MSPFTSTFTTEKDSTGNSSAPVTNTVIPQKCPTTVNTERKTIAMLGAGAWGSALATLASVNDHELRVWSRRGELSLEEAIAGADVIVSAISMKGVRSVAAQLQELTIPKDAIIVTATKGLEPKTTLTPSQIWKEAFPENPVVVLSGPNLSKEIEGESQDHGILSDKSDEKNVSLSH